MIEVVHESMFHWYRLLGGASAGARTLEADGVLAALVPAAPERSFSNAVLYRSPAALESAYDGLKAAYAEFGAKWTVWVPPGDERAAAFLEGRGHVLDGEPLAMGRELWPGAVERPAPGELPEWTTGAELGEIARINDRSYTHGTDSFARTLARPLDGAVATYLVRWNGEPAGCVMTVDLDRNAEVQMVAVLPEARGHGLAGKLLAHALSDAAERGATSSTLIATQLGRPVYERAGFGELGTFQMWELRPAGHGG